MTGRAHDTPLDQLAEAVYAEYSKLPPSRYPHQTKVADALLPVVLRYADAQVAAERERIAAAAADPKVIESVAWALDPVDGMEDEGRESLAVALAAFADVVGERADAVLPVVRRYTDAQVAARLAAVRALHREEWGACQECSDEIAVSWPCPTVLALDGEQL